MAVLHTKKERTVTLTDRQICDLALLFDSSLAPVDSFLGKKDYISVLESMRLSNGELYPIPITFDLAERVDEGSLLSLCDQDGTLLATLEVEEVWQREPLYEAEAVYGTTSSDHPGVAYISSSAAAFCISGNLKKVQAPKFLGFRSLRYSPAEVRAFIQEKGWKNTVAFQTRNPMHRAHQELTVRALEEVGEGGVLLHPVVGTTKPGDIDFFTRVSCYQKILPYYNANQVLLSLLPLSMRMAGPREAVWHGLIRKQYGATHLIVGRDHASPGCDRFGTPFYTPDEAQELYKTYEEEIGVKMIPFQEMQYVSKKDRYFPVNQIPKGEEGKAVSGTKIRDYLNKGERLPRWVTFPEVAEILENRFKSFKKKGLVILFTGLSGAGKSTLASSLQERFLEEGERTVSLLDGDIVRKGLSSELGFSREHRSINVRRIGFVAAEVASHGGIALCAPIAPYHEDREAVRSMAEKIGNFVLVYVATPLKECEARDTKGLYAKAREGIIPEFTGISDPYEAPETYDLKVSTVGHSEEELCDQIWNYLINKGYI